MTGSFLVVPFAAHRTHRARRPSWRHDVRAVLLLGLLIGVLLAGAAAPAAAEPDLPAPAGWPLTGAPRVLRGFDPPGSAYGAGHRGVDLAAARGDPVLAAAAGVVAFAGRVGGKPVISVQHGAYRTTYEPVVARATTGQHVVQGEIIGVVAAGDHCAGGCLHWGLKRGATYLDPLLLIRASADGRLRLVGDDRAAAVGREAAARAVAASAAADAVMAAWAPGSPGSHGFLHPVPGAITSGFGRRFHPVLHVWKLHDGTDFGAGCGTPIRAAYGGRVTRVSRSTGYGNRLFLDHGRVDGHAVVTAYNHAERYVVRPGQRVTRGQVIGYVGRTGYATGCHLHLMVWLDHRLTNPMSWL